MPLSTKRILFSLPPSLSIPPPPPLSLSLSTSFSSILESLPRLRKNRLFNPEIHVIVSLLARSLYCAHSLNRIRSMLSESDTCTVNDKHGNVLHSIPFFYLGATGQESMVISEKRFYKRGYSNK